MSVTVLHGDALTRLRELPSESVQCMVTSPPYWGLRDYGVPGQLGLEKTPGEYLARMVEVFREARRVLRRDGTMWVNMGDSYAGGGNGGGGSFANDGPRMMRMEGTDKNKAARSGARGAVGGLKPKDLVGMPWRLAFALQDDGWYLRSDIIWHKPNPMPESVRDRPTKAHEYLFLFSKSARYFYDAEAIKEPVTGGAHARGNGKNPKCSGWMEGDGAHRTLDHAKPGGSYKGSVPGRADGPGQSRRSTRPRQNESFSEVVTGLVALRNKRDVWTIPPEPFRDAHFATFPRRLVEPCVLSGTSAGGCCALCRAPRRRIVEAGAPDLAAQRACGGDDLGEYHGTATKEFAAAGAQDASAVKARVLAGMRPKVTVEWRPTCACPPLPPVPCNVLDFFGGSGTVAEVAQRHGRDAILIELNAEYLPLITRRCAA